MHLCTALIYVEGNLLQSVQKYPRHMTTYAEIVLLRIIHGGPESVRNVQIFDEIPDEEFDFAEEKRRLFEKYGAVANEAYPGHMPQMPSDASNDPHPGDPADIREQEKPKRSRGKKSEGGGGNPGTGESNPGTGEGFPG